MNPSTTEIQAERETLLGQIRAWEHELDEMFAENSRLVINAQAIEDKKLIAHFENQFAIQKNRLDQMKHHLKLSGASSTIQDGVNEFATYFRSFRDAFVAFSEGLM
jgi:hypothetical protein